MLIYHTVDIAAQWFDADGVPFLLGHGLPRFDACVPPAHGKENAADDEQNPENDAGDIHKLSPRVEFVSAVHKQSIQKTQGADHV